VLAWDIWNEPDNKNEDYRSEEVTKKAERVDALLPLAFDWARSAHPMQPLTSAVWEGNWSDLALESPTTKIQLAESDIISFHNYSWPEEFESRIRSLLPYGRPIICSEYMARGAGSTFDNDLPIAKHYNIGVFNWGLIAGKLRRIYLGILGSVPSSDRAYRFFRSDDTPYRQHEIDLLRDLTSRGAH
ncbi:MAG TPA: 1,4-beta-xylanase, partial [Terracidiphilus sp.]